jgi:hypothetical protein
VRTREGDVNPWTFMEGHGGNVAGVALRISADAERDPELLGASRGTDARVLLLGKFFEPDGSVKIDADDSVHDLSLETRDYGTGTGRRRNRNTVRRAAVFYELWGDDPHLRLEVSDGRAPDLSSTPKWDEVEWDFFEWADEELAEFTVVSGTAPPSDGRAPYSWEINRHAVWVRYRLTSSGAIGNLKIRSIESMSRPSEAPF